MFLGLDLGTSSLKAVVIDEEAFVRAESSYPLEVDRKKPLYSEQNPEDWWQATQRAVTRLPQAIRSQITHIGLTGQMHGAVLLGENGAPLRPAILWDDGRSKKECLQLAESVPDYQEITGNLIMPGFTAPKLLWVETHEATIFPKIHKVLLPKDYLRYRMSKVYATDASDASGTCFLDVKKRSWSPSMLSACKLSEDHMPRVFEGPNITSRLTKKAAEKLGLSSKVEIVAGGSDNAASGLSVGCISEEIACLSLGSSGVYFNAKTSFCPNPERGVHTYCHALPNLWHQMSVHLSSASCFSFLEKIVKKPVPLLTEELQKTMFCKNDLFFLPYLAGERTPHNDPYAKGVFFGLTHRTTTSDLLKAVMEGTAFALKSGQDAMEKTRQAIDTIYVLGGGVHNLLWVQTISSILQKPLYLPEHGNMGAGFGAAKLARFSALNISLKEAFPKESKTKTIFPDPSLYNEYQEKEEVFQELYHVLAPIFFRRR